MTEENLAIRASLIFNLMLQIDSCRIEAGYGVLPFNVDPFLDAIEHWMDLIDDDQDARLIIWAGYQIEMIFPNNDRLAALRWDFEQYLNFQTCLWGFGAAAA